MLMGEWFGLRRCYCVGDGRVYIVIHRAQVCCCGYHVCQGHEPKDHTRMHRDYPHKHPSTIMGLFWEECIRINPMTYGSRWLLRTSDGAAGILRILYEVDWPSRCRSCSEIALHSWRS